MVLQFKGKKNKQKVVVGGAYAEIKKDEEVSKLDKLKNVSIIKTPSTAKANKISQEKLNKFVNLKLT